MGGRYDVAIIGGGHNGLVAAAYLTRHSLKPVVLEARDVIGGAAVHARPAAGFADPRTPVRGLYQAGSATHGGGGVTGIPGRNVVRQILRDRRADRWRRRRP